MSRLLKATLLGIALATSAAPALAHSTVKSTTPVSGSIMTASPPEVVINFSEPARLTSVVLLEPGLPDRKLDFGPSGMATTFTLPAPNLGSGRNEIKWKALSKDGHPIEGSIIVVIRSGPALPPDLQQPTQQHSDHKGG